MEYGACWGLATKAKPETIAKRAMRLYGLDTAIEYLCKCEDGIFKMGYYGGIKGLFPRQERLVKAICMLRELKTRRENKCQQTESQPN